MFARYFVELPVESERVEAALVAATADDWLPGIASTSVQTPMTT